MAIQKKWMPQIGTQVQGELGFWKKEQAVKNKIEISLNSAGGHHERRLLRPLAAQIAYPAFSPHF
jgi:hypothetical protein